MNVLTSLNTDIRVLWFDDLGSGNEEFSFLSNFHEGESFELGGEWFKTGEHAFQAYKAKTRKAFEMVRDAGSPGHAKALGRTIPLRKDWEIVKYDVMAAVVRAKFRPGTALSGRLLSTGDRLLMEGTYWHDRVWGTDLNADWTSLPPGRNWLGTLLMARRAELRAWVSGAGIQTHEHNASWAIRAFD